MIAANGVDRALSRAARASRRCAASSDRPSGGSGSSSWPRSPATAAGAADARALEEFLASAQAADPDRFPDLSLVVIKLLGPGEYVVEPPGEPSAGHFGLAVKDYTHSTAPNRRFPDLVTQRLVKAALAGQPVALR